MHIRTTFMFVPEEDHPSVSEGLSVRQVRKLQSQVTKAVTQSQRDSHPQGRLRVAEVFSPPRFALVVELNNQRAKSYDIKNGYDFSKPSVRRAAK